MTALQMGHGEHLRSTQPRTSIRLYSARSLRFCSGAAWAQRFRKSPMRLPLRWKMYGQSMRRFFSRPIDDPGELALERQHPTVLRLAVLGSEPDDYVLASSLGGRCGFGVVSEGRRIVAWACRTGARFRWGQIPSAAQKGETMTLDQSRKVQFRCSVGLGIVVAAIALSPIISPAATCPEDIRTCLGVASEFHIVAENRAFLQQGRRRPEPGVNEVFGTEVGGAVCATTAKLKGGLLSETEVAGDLILLAESGTAVRFAPTKVFGETMIRISIAGDLITAGGSISGAESVVVGGVVDTSGTHPKLDLCRQAMIDAAQASATLGGLPAAEDLERIIAQPFEIITLDFTGSGAQVKRAISIKLKSEGSDRSELYLGMDETVDSAILNVDRSVSIGTFGLLVPLVVPPDPTKQGVLNISLPGRVQVKTDGRILVTILAPQTRIRGKARTDMCQLYGYDVLLKGTDATRTCLPPASPSGAFLDGGGGVLD